MMADAKADFIRIEIQLGNTMLNLARTELKMGDLEGAKKAIANARNAKSSAERFLAKLMDAPAEIMNELVRDIEDLEGAIREYESL